jgi:parallel beta-helix repeat protein
MCKKQTKLNMTVLLAVLVFFILGGFTAAEEFYDANSFVDPNCPDDIDLLMFLDQPPDYSMPGPIEGTGTSFEITDSDYLNVTLISSELVQIRLESIPNMVTIEIEAAEDANSTTIMLAGFTPQATYYKYQDDYHHLEELTTNKDGRCVYTQDLSEPHIVFIQPTKSTIFLSDSGWSDPGVGTWDSVTKTGTLTQDLTQTIQIDSDGITLDGAGHFVSGSGSGYGVYLYKKTDITINNLNINNFSYGIYAFYAPNITLINNTVSNCSYGIELSSSGGSTMRSNTMSSNTYNLAVEGEYNNDIDIGNTVDGRPVYYVMNIDGVTYDSSTNAGVFYAVNCTNLVIKDLTLVNNYHGLFLLGVSNSTIENVTISNNRFGIECWSSSNNTLISNNVSANYYGIYSRFFHNNTLTNNIISNSGYQGMHLGLSNGNTLTDNTLTFNEYGIYLSSSNQNVLTGNKMSDNNYNFWISGSLNNDIELSNTVDGKPLWYVQGAEGVVYDSSTNAGAFYAVNCNNITIKDIDTSSHCQSGISLWYTSNSTIENVTVSNNNRGIYLNNSNNNKLINSTASDNYYGISLEYSNDNLITDNTALNNQYGIFVSLYCVNNTVSQNIVTSNEKYGITIGAPDNIITGNTVSSNQYGITVSASSSGNVLSNNVMFGNQYNFYIPCSSAGALYENNIDTSNLVEGKPILYLYNASDLVFEDPDIYGVAYLINCNNITLRNQALSPNNYYGVGMSNTHNSIVENVSASNSDIGIGVWYSNNNTLSNNTVSDNRYGVYAYSSVGNTLTENTANSNMYGIHLRFDKGDNLIGNTASDNTNYGIYLNTSTGNMLTGNHASGNGYGIYLDSSSNGSTLTANNAVSNTYAGICIYHSQNCELTDNTTSNNQIGIRLSYTANNTVMYNTNEYNSSYGIYISYSANDNAIISNTCNFSSYGVYMTSSSGNLLTNNTILDNNHGVRLYNSNNNTLTDNTIELCKNYGIGVNLYNSNNNTLADNTIELCDWYGMYMSNSNNNDIFNNNFIDNKIQISVYGNDNIFSHDAPIGGNYWSNWTGPDNNGDGFVDYPYIFNGGQDDLPWALPNGWVDEPPAAPVIGFVDYDEANNQTTVSGTAEPGSTIRIYDEDGNLICETVADEYGFWECNISGNYEGNSMAVTASDENGNTSPAAQPPAAPVIVSVDYDESEGFTTIVGTAEPGMTITIYDENGNVLCQTIADENGIWECVLTGNYEGSSITVTASDENGNTSPAAQPPMPPVIVSVDYDETSELTTISGTAEPGTIITIYDENGNILCQTIADENGMWQCELSGNYEGSSITVTASDENGNTSPTAQPPAAPVIGSVAYDEASNQTTVMGSAEPGSIITIYDENGNILCQTIADENGIWECVLAGNYEGSSITVTASDENGNTSPAANVPPVANPGPDQTVTDETCPLGSESVTLNGSGSNDPDGTIASYTWTENGVVIAMDAIATLSFAVGIHDVELSVTDNDGFPDTSHVIVTVLQADPATMISALTNAIKSFNLQQGIANSLDSKLENAQAALTAANAGLREDAINKLEAFKAACEAQRDKFLTSEQADALIRDADYIISSLLL